MTPDIDPEQLLASNQNIVILGIVSDYHEIKPPIAIRKLRTSQAYIACTDDFPYIASNQSTVSLKELRHVPLAVSKISFEFQKILLEGIQQYGNPNIKVFAPNHYTVISAIRSGIAAGFSNMFFPSPENDRFRLIPIRNTPKFHLSLVYNCSINPQKIESLTKLLDPYLI